MHGTLRIGGSFFWEHLDRKGRVVKSRWVKNAIVTAALNDLLEVYFRAGTEKMQWFLSLIDRTAFSALAASDTMALHPGWSEITAYTPGTRPPWTPAAVADGFITDSAGALFTFSAPKTVAGLFLASDSTKAGTTGTLWTTGALGEDEDFDGGEQLRAYYDLTAASA